MEILRKLRQYAKTDRTAIIYGEKTLSYRDLNAWSDAFAAFLRRTQPENKTPVLLYGHKDLEIPACMFGCLKAGRGYIPVDVTYPPERVAQIEAMAKPGLAVDFTGTLETPCLSLPGLRRILTEKAQSAPEENWCKEDETAYILFTSGSTGTPKGVQITAGNLAAFHEGVKPWFDAMQEGGAFLNEISYSFDVSVCALYEALGRGMTLWTADLQTLSNPKALFSLLKEANLTDWVSTPSLAELCVQSASFRKDLMPKLRQFLFCGEVLTKKLCGEIFARFPGVPVVNAYGPTETTVLVTGAEMTQKMLDSKEPLPIGFAFSNCAVEICGEDGKALPDGEAGELRISGKTVSPGYLGRPDLNERAFFETNGLRGYRTGDLCKKIDGCIYYLGRLDNQIKLNGFRVELEDVENNLVKVQNVARAAVLPEMQDGKVVSLTAYVLLEKPDGEGSLQRARRIRKELSALVPSYMTPRKIIAVESFPLNTNGKIDKKRLREQSAT